MPNYLFLFTIGPVQSFIAQARKTRDLYAGSQVLSELCRTGLKVAVENGATVIFPKATINSSSLPNRFIVEFKNVDSAVIKEIGQVIEQEVRVFFTSLAGTSLKNVCGNGDTFKEFNDQINNFLQIHWAAVEFDEESYKNKHLELEALLGSVKNVRAFKQLPEEGRKCSLCGERNVLFYSGKKRAYIPEDYAKEVNTYLMSQGEGLCAVCNTKRFYQKEESFPSTAEVALIDVIALMDKTKLKEFKDLFKDQFDYQLLYDENLNSHYFDKNGLKEYLSKIPEAQKTLKEILKDLKDKDKKLKSYYAMLMFDADHMGQWLSGDFLKEGDLRKFHESLSEKLGAFSVNIKDKITKNEYGACVYAGGDDFLGLINLSHLFDVMEMIRNDFKTEVYEPLKKNNNNTFNLTEQELTLSTGVTIAHYKTPLHVVLDHTRKMEQLAKNEGRRNAFAIGVIKHSGELIQTYWKWKIGDIDNIEVIKKISDGLETKQFTSAFIQKIQNEFAPLIDSQSEKISSTKPLEAELKRLIRRSCEIQNQSKNGKIDDYFKFAKNLSKQSGQKAQRFFDLLNIIDFLIRKTGEGA
ncbi:MAG: type III-B CRISPR-associated protein Cas10/Cmr2 [Bacteroidales bacterium]|nr:type III-B CRISPR-associated protein Cas10/Cmr2 [Bacteroidales bacterium]